MDGKSTAAHAAILAPADVSVHIYPAIPVWSQTENIVLVFPSDNAMTLKQLAKLNEKNAFPENESTENDKEERLKQSFEQNHEKINPCLFKFDRVVFIDCTWHQTKRICTDERLSKLKCVILESHSSRFWRYQRRKKDCFLATIEAIYYFFVDLHRLNHVVYDGRFDNLLFFFRHSYNQLKERYSLEKCN